MAQTTQPVHTHAVEACKTTTDKVRATWAQTDRGNP